MLFGPIFGARNCVGILVVVQEQRHHVSGLCLEAAAIREGRGVAQMAARMEAMSGAGKSERPIASTDCSKRTYSNARVRRASDGTCRQNHRHGACEARSYACSSTPNSSNSPRAPLASASTSNKRPLRTHSPHPVRTKRPALAPIQEGSGGESSADNPGSMLLGYSAPGLAGRGGGSGLPHCLVVKHVGAAAEITPAWQQAIKESQAKAKHDEDSENRATELSRRMEQLGKEAAQRVSRAHRVQDLERDIAAHDATKRAERLAALSRTRRSKLQRSALRSGDSGRGHQDVSGFRMTQHVDNHRVRRSVYCRPGDGGEEAADWQSMLEQNMPAVQLQDPGTGTRHPLGELEPGFFSSSGR